MSDAFVPDGIENPDPAHVHAFETFLDATLGPVPKEEPEQLELDIEVKFDWLAMAADRLDQLGTRLATEHQPHLNALFRYVHCRTCHDTVGYVPVAWPCVTAQTILDHVGLPASQIKMPNEVLGEFAQRWILGTDAQLTDRQAAQLRSALPVIWVTDGAGGWVKSEPSRE